MKSTRMLCVLLVIMAVLGLGNASAEMTSKSDLMTIMDLIDERTADGYDDFLMDEEVVIDDKFSFTLTDMSCLESDTEGIMQVQCRLTLNSMMEGLSASDYDFVLVTPKDDGSFEYYWADGLYGVLDSGTRVQGFSWPLSLSANTPMDIILTYEVPKDETMIGFVYTNVWGNETDGYTIGGNLKSYTKVRTVMDFRLINSSEKTVNELYVVPADNRTWGDNLLLGYDSPVLENGIWMAIEFSSTPWEDSIGQLWELRVVFDDGETAEFSEIDLDDILCLELVKGEEEGRYTLLVTR